MLAGAWKSYLKKLQKTHKTPEGRQCEAPCRCLLGLAPFSRHPDFLVGRNSTEWTRGLSDGCFVALLLCGVLGPVPAGPLSFGSRAGPSRAAGSLPATPQPSLGTSAPRTGPFSPWPRLGAVCGVSFSGRGRRLTSQKQSPQSPVHWRPH